MKDFKKKLDKPERVKELNPSGTLEKLGLEESHIFCDIGAGTGIFTIEAAKKCKEAYALDINEELLDIIKEKASSENLENINLIKVDSDSLNVENEKCDLVLLSTVLHEVENKDSMINEIHRILKPNGKVAIIEFHKKDAPYGPPIEEKISPDEMDIIFKDSNLKSNNLFNIGDKFYCKIYKKEC